MDPGFAGLLSGTRLADVVLGVTGLEAAVLLAWRHRTGRGLGPGPVGAMLMPGVLLLLGLRVALAGGAWQWLAACLALAGLAHAVDLAGRLARGQ